LELIVCFHLVIYYNHLFQFNESYDFFSIALDHETALNRVLKLITDPIVGAVSNVSDIAVVGHRVAHGGPELSQPVVVDELVMTKLKEAVSCSNPCPIPLCSVG
jgi:acetate kinase